MKKIILSRHAKSSWADFSIPDIERPLNGRGRRDGPYMASELKSRVERIDLLVSSPAKRAQLTMQFFKDVYPDADIIKDERIYEAFTSDLLNVIHDLSDDYHSAMMFGHNPSFTSFYNQFSENTLDNLPTCGMFSLSSLVSHWREMTPENTVVDFLIYPKMFQ